MVKDDESLIELKKILKQIQELNKKSYNIDDLIKETEELFEINNLSRPEIQKIGDGVMAYTDFPFYTSDGRRVNLCLKLIPGTPSRLEAGLRVHNEGGVNKTATKLVSHTCRTGLSSGPEMIPATILNYAITMNTLNDEEASTYAFQIMPHILDAVHGSARKLGVNIPEVNEIIHNKLRKDLDKIIENIYTMKKRVKVYRVEKDEINNQVRKCNNELEDVLYTLSNNRIIAGSLIIRKYDLIDEIKTSHYEVSELDKLISNEEGLLNREYMFYFSGTLFNLANLEDNFCSKELSDKLSRKELIPYLINSLSNEYLMEGYTNIEWVAITSLMNLSREFNQEIDDCYEKQKSGLSSLMQMCVKEIIENHTATYYYTVHDLLY